VRRIAIPLLAVSLGVIANAGADGMLDPSFGNGGLVVTNFGGAFDQDNAGALVVLPDGRAVAAGSTSPFLEATYMAAARYLVSGALDPTFGTGGLVTVDFFEPPPAFGSGDIAESVLLQPDGRLVLVGGTSYSPPATSLFALARLQPDGSLDPSFGVGGRVTTSVGGQSAASAGVLQPDGRIVAVGDGGLGGSGTLAAARYTINGTLDPTFGTGGILLLSQFPGQFTVHDLALQPDGKLVIAGRKWNATYDFMLVRLLPDGTPDPTFDGDGLVTSDFGAYETGASVIVLADGRIILGGYREQGSAADFALVRYLPNGAVDTTFGNGGLVLADSGAAEIADHLIQLPNGNLLLAGYTNDAGAGAHDFLLARFLPDGAIDTSFGTAGFLRTGFVAGSTDECHAVAVAGQDLVLTAGSVTAPGTFAPDFGLARYIATVPVALRTFTVE